MIYRDVATIVSAIGEARSQIVEAVRGLKPEVTDTLVSDLVRERDRLRIEELQQRTEAERMRPVLRQAHAEIGRLQARVADDALAIGALKDENAQLKQDIVDWKCSEACTVDDLAELKRFREREKLVTAVLRLADGEAFDDGWHGVPGLADAIAAVRDFKVTNPEGTP